MSGNWDDGGRPTNAHQPSPIGRVMEVFPAGRWARQAQPVSTWAMQGCPCQTSFTAYKSSGSVYTSNAIWNGQVKAIFCMTSKQSRARAEQAATHTQRRAVDQSTVCVSQQRTKARAGEETTDAASTTSQSLSAMACQLPGETTVTKFCVKKRDEKSMWASERPQIGLARASFSRAEPSLPYFREGEEEQTVPKKESQK